MKEQLNIVILSEAKNLIANGLTTRPFPPTLGRERNIFMAENGEGQKPASPQRQRLAENISPKPLSPERIAQINKGWDDWTTNYLKEQGRPLLTFEERQGVEIARRAGRLPHPVAGGIGEREQPTEPGGAGDLPPPPPPEAPPATPAGEEPEERRPLFNLLEFTADERLQDMARQANALGEHPDPRLLNDLVERVNRLLDVRGELITPESRNQAMQISSRLNELLAEAMAAARAEAEERGFRYFSPSEERDIRGDAKRREEIFEQIFVGVDAAPGTEFNTAFSFEARSRLDRFLTLISEVNTDEAGNEIDQNDHVALSRQRERVTAEFSGRSEIRKILHDANWGVSGGGDIRVFANAAATYRDEYTDLIFTDPLVETALHFFEQGFQQIKADNDGVLRYEDLAWNYKTKRSGLEDRVWNSMREAVEKGVVGDIVRDQNGEIVRDENGRPQREMPPEWRLRRAIVLARGFGVLSLRFPEIAAEARLPEQTVLTGADTYAHRYASIYGEAVAKYLDPMEHLIEKFGIGLEDRAILYYFLTGDKRKFQSKAALQNAIRQSGQFKKEDGRLIDEINYFRTGGPFSRSSWRTRVSFVRLPNESEEAFENRLRQSGTGVRESKVEGDVDDQIKAEVRRNSRFAGMSDEEITSSGKNIKDFEDAVEARKKEVMPGENGMKHKDYLLLDKRLAMWKDTLRSNPLRVMWEWEKRETEDKKNPGQRERFLSEALEPLGINQDEAKGLLGSVERDLMLLQEEVVSSRKRIPANENEEMLDFNLITDETQRRNVRLYVDKIREKAAEGDYRFFKEDLLKHSSVTDSPFPFVVGFEDIPFADYDFINSGGRGMSRKITDFASAATASTELINLITGFGTAQSIEPLVGKLVEIKNAIAQVDGGLAMELVPPIAEGIIRMYDKDWVAKLPLGIGTFMGLTGDTSFVQAYKGRGAMSWDEGDKYRFTTQLLQNSLILKKDLEKLRWKTGATVFHNILDFARTYGQLMLLLMAVEFAGRTAKGK